LKRQTEASSVTKQKRNGEIIFLHVVLAFGIHVTGAAPWSLRAREFSTNKTQTKFERLNKQTANKEQ